MSGSTWALPAARLAASSIFFCNFSSGGEEKVDFGKSTYGSRQNY
jgi:hypothetical protein